MKIIATDIDGTLVKDGSSQINQKYFGVINGLRAAGITFVAASGRQYASIRNMFAPIAECGDFWAIAEGGALVYHNDEVVQKHEMPEEMVEELIRDIRKLRERGCDIMLSAVDGAYCPYEDSELCRWMRTSYKFDIEASGSYDKLPRKGIVKISIYHPFDCEGVAREWFYDKWEGALQISSAGIWWVDCVLPGATKGTALQFIQERLHIRKEETMVFGDNINDIPMLACAGAAYAVENGREQTKAAADRVIPPYWENGVLQVMEDTLAELEQK